MIDERTERLINRKLDGELTDAESLELDKLLIRDPQARAFMDEYAQLDQQAGRVLQAVAAARVERISAQEISAGWNRSPLQWWYSFTLVSAIAAAITLAVLLSQRAAGLDPQQTESLAANSTSPRQALVTRDGQSSELPVDYVSMFEDVSMLENPRRETLNVQRDVIGFWDRQSRSLYLIEADVARSSLEPVKVNY